MALTAPQAYLLALIKPQFEVGRENVGRGGIVRDENLHNAVIKRLQDWINLQKHWRVLGVTESPIKGTRGNKEFLIAAYKEIDKSTGK